MHTGVATQSQQILAILKSGRRLTPIEALEEVHCFRLAARVKDLRNEGYDIQTESYELPNGKHVARYWLPLPKGQLDMFQTKGLVGEVQPGLS